VRSNGGADSDRERQSVAVQNPANLLVTGEARALAVAVYHATSRFPASERFGLASQMQRSAVSVGSNIAEGCERFGNRELVHFLQIALGSASELEFQTQVAMELELLAEATDEALIDQINHVKRMLARLIKSHRSRTG
jgi:four helix bundle protein